jgi:HAD superfamily phosphoserine phosphatase-like hydrolase
MSSGSTIPGSTNSGLIVASDLEGTLSSGETWKAMAAYLERDGKSPAKRKFFNALIVPAILAKIGLSDKRAFQNRCISSLPELFAGFTELEFSEVAEWVVEHHLWPKRKTHVIAELEKFKLEGARLILVSGTYQPVLEAFAARLNAEAIGSPLEVVDGKLTGRLSGPINVGIQKVSSLKSHGISSLGAAFGDTLPDLAMLEMAQNPVVIPTDAKFEKLGIERGWQFLRT